jgi:AraC-like DNA-binding protein
MIRRLILIGVPLLAVAFLAGGVLLGRTFADTPTPTPTPAKPQAQTLWQDWLNRVARILNVSPDQLTSAFKQAGRETVQQAVQDGKLTQDQANRILQRIDQGRFFFGPFFGMRGPAVHFDLRRHLDALAGFLGMNTTDLMNELRSGKSLAQVAQEHGKSRDALKNFLTQQFNQAVDQLVQQGRLTQDQANNAKTRFQQNLDRLIDATFKASRGWR